MMFVDGLEIGDPGDAAVRDRRVLSRDGVVMLVATISAQDGELLSGPELILRGVTQQHDETLLDRIRTTARRSLTRAAREGLHEPELLQQIVHDDLADFLHRETRGRPMILPVLVEL
jgi:ribonuclease J